MPRLSPRSAPSHPTRSAATQVTDGPASGKRQRKRRTSDVEIVTAVDRAACVLMAFTQSRDFLTLLEVAQRAGLSKATAFRILSTLTDEGLVFQNASNSTYGLGALNLRFADIILSDIEIHKQARAVMRQIRDSVNETVVLSVRQGADCYHVDSFESTQSIIHSQSIGMPFPLHSVLSGHVMLANQPDAAVDAYIKSIPPAARAAVARQLWKQIKAIRSDGYATSSGELAGGGHGVAVAIPHEKYSATVAMHISFPNGRYTTELEQRCIDALKQAAGHLAESGGH
ncbi:MAG: IclR family transcriptional regulator [Hyphomicrobiales bacterium]|nr:IclR family transcriptional regulator [Hyphomicrobiales bacterium]